MSAKFNGRKVTAMRVEHDKIRVYIQGLNDKLEQVRNKEQTDVIVELEDKVTNLMKQQEILESEIELAEIGGPGLGIETVVNDEFLTDYETDNNCCNPFK